MNEDFFVIKEADTDNNAFCEGDDQCGDCGSQGSGGTCWTD